MIRTANILNVGFDVPKKIIVVQCKFEGVDIITRRQRGRARTLPIDCFLRFPEKLFRSEAWMRFEASERCNTYRIRYPSAFVRVDAHQYLLSESRSDDGNRHIVHPPPPKLVQDTLMEWDIAKGITFESIAEANECHICYVDFKDDTMVSVLPCKHVMCVNCFDKWPRCSVCPQRL